MMIGLGTPFRVAGAGTFSSFVSGLSDRPSHVERGTKVEGIHLFLSLLGTRALLGVPAGVLDGQVVDLADILDASSEIQNRLLEASSWEQRFGILDDALTQTLTGHRVASELRWVWHEIVHKGGLTRIDDLARTAGWSRRHFTQRFGTELGLSPKVLGRIARFERACALIEGRECRLADVAAAVGYSDQPHMTREWQALAGCPPRVWISEDLPFVQDYELHELDDGV